MSDDDDQQRLLDADALEPRAAPRRRRLATAAAACVVGVALAVAVLVVLRYAGLLALDWQPPASAANATTPTVPPMTLTMQSATPQPTPGVPRPYVAFLHVSDVHLDEAYDPRFNASAHCHAANRGNRSAPAPAAGSPFGTFGCDSPAALVDAASAAMGAAARAAGAQFVLASGDFAQFFAIGQRNEHAMTIIMSTPTTNSSLSDLFAECGDLCLQWSNSSNHGVLDVAKKLRLFVRSFVPLRLFFCFSRCLCHCCVKQTFRSFGIDVSQLSNFFRDVVA